MMAGDRALKEIMFEALIEYEGRRKWYGYDLVDGLLEALNAAGYTVSKTTDGTCPECGVLPMALHRTTCVFHPQWDGHRV